MSEKRDQPKMMAGLSIFSSSSERETVNLWIRMAMTLSWMNVALFKNFGN